MSDMRLAPGFEPEKIPPALVPAMLAAIEETGIRETTPLFKEVSGQALVVIPYAGSMESIAHGIRERLNEFYSVEAEIDAIIISLVD